MPARRLPSRRTRSLPRPEVTLAAAAGAHGIRGEVRLKLFAESVDSLSRHPVFRAGSRVLTLTSVRAAAGGAVAAFAEVSDRNAAEALRGTTLTVPREALPPLAEGEYYHADLIGLAVVTTDGAAAGSIVAVENFGAGDILDIELAGGRRVMVPLTPEAVPELGENVVVASAYLG